MEVLFGPPTFSIEVPPSSAFSAVSLPSENPSAADTQNLARSGFLRSGSGSSIGENSSESSSSIGVPDGDSDDDGGGGDEVQSKPKEGGLCGLESLEKALPIK